MPRKEPRRPKRTTATTPAEKPVFGYENYLLMGVAATLLFLGFGIMALENQIDGFFSLYISPVLVVTGFIVFGLGIIKKPSEEQNQN